MSFRNRTDCRYNVYRGSILQDVTPRTFTNRREKATPVIDHGDEDAFNKPVTCASRGRRAEFGEQKIQRVEDKDVRAGIANLVEGCGMNGLRCNNLKLRPFGQNL